jgi:hypothetical protein
MIKEASRVNRICIPRCIEVIGSFSGGPDEGSPIASSMKTVRFESSSKVRRICTSFRFSFLDSICIPRSIEILGDLCFSGVRNFDNWSCRSAIGVLSFESNSSLRVFGSECFRECSVKSICIPESVERLEVGCFSDSGLEKIDIGTGSVLREIGGRCFEYCPLKRIFIPKFVCAIEGSAFIGCRLEHIHVDAENDNFEVSRGLLIDKGRRKAIRSETLTKDMIIPKGIEVLGSFCFSTVEMGKLTFEEGIELKEIEARCFEGGSICYICIPSSIESLGVQSFGADEWFKSTVRVIRFEAGSKIAEFSEDCFKNCQIQSICIPRSIEIFPRSCFACNACLRSNDIEEFEFEPASKLTQIEDYCFNNRFPRSICILRSVISLGKSCFASHFFGGRPFDEFSFESGTVLERIGESCFNRHYLKSICIPRSVISIGQRCFYEASVEIVVFESGSKLKELPPECFASCSFKSISIAPSIETLWYQCFATFKGSNIQFGSIIFDPDCQLARISDWCFRCSGMESICIPRSVIEIGKWAFEGCHMLRVVIIESESKLNKIEERCFRGCSLTTIVLPISVTFVHPTAFDECVKIVRQETE